MNFVMTDGRGIKGTSPGFVRGDLDSQNLFFFPSFSIPEAHLRLLAVLLCGPFRIARSQRLRALFVGMHLAWYTCVLCLHHPPPHP